MPDDRRAVLEGIAYGDDLKVTPGDRLRALEQLAALDPPAVAEALAEVGQMTEDQLDAELEAHAVGLVLAVLGDDAAADRHPRLRKVLEHEVDRRVAVRLAEELREVEAARPVAELHALPTPPAQDAEPDEEADGDPAPAEHPPEPEHRSERPPAGESHVPPGVSLEAWRRAWPSGRGST